MENGPHRLANFPAIISSRVAFSNVLCSTMDGCSVYDDVSTLDPAWSPLGLFPSSINVYLLREFHDHFKRKYLEIFWLSAKEKKYYYCGPHQDSKLFEGMASCVLQIVLVKTSLRKKKFEFHKEVFYNVYQKKIIVLKRKILLL